jgi:hypothetical protein
MANKLRASHQIHTSSHPRTTELKRNQRKLNIYQSIAAQTTPTAILTWASMGSPKDNDTQATTLQPPVELS